MIDVDTLSDAILDPAADEATRRAAEAIAAWHAFPPAIRSAYGKEARRLARRAASALVALIEVAARHSRVGDA